jgi:hypothetical protein
MHFHEFPHPSHRARVTIRPVLAVLAAALKYQSSQARARVQVAISHGVIGWSHKHGPTVVAAGNQHPRRDIGSVLAPEKVDVSLENRPQAEYACPPGARDRRA